MEETNIAMVETDDVATLEFKWGKKKGVGGKKKEVQFYASFTYDGVDYNLYDSVYMHKEGEPEPYIGKLIKIWENGDKTKKVKVQWFFRPSEISGWIGDVRVLENEILLASGEGVGLANVNNLEAIAGKCNVVCISKDSRNHQPSEEELKLADYIFYRTFDVGLCTILDKMDDKVGGTEVAFVFNKKESETACGVPELIPDGKEGKQQISIKVAPDELKYVVTNGDNNQSMAANDVKDVIVKCDYITDMKPASVSAVEFNTPATTIGQPTSPLGKEVTGSKSGAVKDEFKRATDSKEAEKRPRSANSFGDLEEKSTKKAKKDDFIKSSVDKSTDSAQILIVKGNDVKAMSTTADTPVEKTKYMHGDPIKKEKGVKLDKESDDLENKPSEKAKVECPRTEKNSSNIDKVIVISDLNCGNNLATSETSFGERTKSKVAEDSFGPKGPSNKEKVDDKMKLSGCKLPKRPDMKVVSTTAETYKENTKSGCVDPLGQDKGVKFDRKPDDMEDKPSKKQKVECPSKEKNSNNIEKKGPTNEEKLDSKTKGPSGGKLPKRPASDSGYEDRETEGNIFDVTGRPDTDKSKWFRQSPFEDRVEGAQNNGTILLLHNLDPEYVSVEVEEIMWHAFKEHCSAKMVQRTTISTPHSGQAIVIFKTREGTEKVVRKLNEGCLMLPNGRPLVCSTLPTFSEKQSTYYGHLVIDNKIQAQREKKDAVSTSHCSQPNTIEYDMAMEWCLIQSRSDTWWKRLYKQHGQELRKLEAKIKSK